MKLYLTGLRSYCVDLGMADLSVFEDPRLQRTLRGIKIFHAARETGPRERLPITRDLLLRLVARLDISTYEGSTLQAAFCLAFAAFLRIGEFTWSSTDWNAGSDNFHQWHMTRSSVHFYPTPTQGHIPERLLLTLPATKTDPFRRGITLTIAAVNDNACAVTALYHLMTRWPTAPYAPLFSNIPFHTFAANNSLASFDRNWVVTRLRNLLLEEGVPGHYSGHSFRRGAATWARQAGISDEDIQLLGRWKSDAYKRYIEVHPEHILGVSRRLQTFSSPPHQTSSPAPLPPMAPSGMPNAVAPSIPRPTGWLVGELGRVGRGVGEPGPASGVAASAGRGGHPLAPRAASGPARGSPPRPF